MVSDVLAMEVPSVVRTELLCGRRSAWRRFTVVGQRLGMSSHLAAPIGATLCITLRLLAPRYGWHYPLLDIGPDPCWYRISLNSRFIQIFKELAKV